MKFTTVAAASLKVMILQDASDSMGSWLKHMRDGGAKTFYEVFAEEMAERGVEDFQIGAASFVDKPIPSLGYGPYGGYRVPDYCYAAETPGFRSAEGVSAFYAAWDGLFDKRGSGNDYWENPLEGIMYGVLDPQFDWSSDVKIIVIITDNLFHREKDAKKALKEGWNAPRRVTRPVPQRSTKDDEDDDEDDDDDDDDESGGVDNNIPPSCWSRDDSVEDIKDTIDVTTDEVSEQPVKTAGGFGSHTFFHESGQINPSLETRYNEMADLFVERDVWKNLTEDGAKRLEQLIQMMGPEKWDPIGPPKYSFATDCSRVEYPNAYEVGKLLRRANIFPLYLVMQPDVWGAETAERCRKEFQIAPSKACLIKAYHVLSREMDVGDRAIALDTDISMTLATRVMATHIASFYDAIVNNETYVSPLQEETTSTEPEITSTAEQALDDHISGLGLAVGATVGVAGAVALVGGLLFSKFGLRLEGDDEEEDFIET